LETRKVEFKPLTVRSAAMNDSQLPDDTSPDESESAQPSPAPVVNAAAPVCKPRCVWMCGVVTGVLCIALGLAVGWLGRSYWSPSVAEETGEDAETPAAPHSATAVLQLSAAGPADFDACQRTSRQLLLSRAVLAAALANPRVADLEIVRRQDDPVAWLRGAIEVTFSNGAGLMEIRLWGERPEPLVELLSAVVETHVKHSISLEEDRRNRRLEHIDAMVQSTQDKLQAKQAALDELAEKLGTDGGDPDGLARQLVLLEFAECRKELLGIEADLTRARIALRRQRELLATINEAKITDAELDAFVQADPLTGQAVLQWTEQLRRELADIDAIASRSATTRYVEASQRDIAEIREQLATERDKLREELRRRKRDALWAKTSQLEEQIALQEKLQEEFAGQVETRQEEVEKSAPPAEIQAKRLEIESLNTLLGRLAVEAETLRAESDAALPPIVVVQPAKAVKNP